MRFGRKAWLGGVVLTSLLCSWSLFSGCSSSGSASAGPSATPSPSGPAVQPRDYLAGLPTGAAQAAILCARGHQDVFSKWYCGTHPTITSLEDVLEGVGLKDPTNPSALNFAITGHSTSLITRHTTSLNPRVVIFSAPNVPPPFGQGPSPTSTPGPTPSPTATPSPTPGYIALGFSRGDQIVEVAAFDPAKQDINFYLIAYSKPCDPSCSSFERFTPETEHGWQNVTVYGDADIHNTPLDCLPCHQPAGLSTPRMLRMQELQNPWTHWFRPGGASQALQMEFLAAHPGEDYGGIPFALIDNTALVASGGGPNAGPGPTATPTPGTTPLPGGPIATGNQGDPAQLEFFVESAGFFTQPNEFLGATIESEGRGPTWLGIDANSVDGTMISVPFYAVDPYDPARLADATQAYLGWKTGGADPSTVPDLTDLFPQAELGDLGFEASPLAVDGLMVVQHRCGTCHSGLFPDVSRNNFDIHQFPAGLSAAERDQVLWRIRLPVSSVRRMPPHQFSDLTEGQIELIEAALGATSHP